MGLLSVVKKLLGLGSQDGRKLSCMDCQTSFVFDEGEQQFFKEKGFTDPKRCPDCRKKVRSKMRRRGGRRQGRRGGFAFSRKHSGIDGASPYADER